MSGIVRPVIKQQPRLYCSFCGKHDGEVPVLIAGPTVFICNECVEICIQVIVEKGVPLSIPTIIDIKP